MRNEIILCLAYSPWNFWRTDNEEMTYLAEKNKIIYVEKQENRGAFRSRFPYIKIFQPLQVKRAKDNIIVLSAIPRLPLSFSILRFPEKLVYLSIVISKWILRIKIKKILKKLKMKPTLLWCYEPWDLLLAGYFGEKKVCYRVYDEISLFPGLDSVGPAIEKIEKKLLKRADIIFASSFSQYKKRKSHHPNTYFISHSCNFSLYNQTLHKNFEKPEDMKNLESLVIGFVGVVDHRIDWPLIIYLAENRLNWSILFVGRIENIPERYLSDIQALPNILFLGEKKPEELPSYLKFIDVSIMPYIVTELLSAAFPRKLYEHLASGKPVVSTYWPEVVPFDGVIKLAKNKEEFLLFIEKQIVPSSPDEIIRRVNLAKENSWEERLEKMENLINNCRRS